MDYFTKMRDWIDDTPTVEQPVRFGNKAFRTWLQIVIDDCPKFMIDMTGNEEASVEITHYFLRSFGSYGQLNYGTGHELNFILFLMSLFKIGYLKRADLRCCVNQVFWTYLIVVRRLQHKYALEPCDNDRIWSLDDYQFLPFLLGASQLNGSETLPESTRCQDEGPEVYEEFLYFSCLKFIKKMKSGIHFSEAQPLLNDIAAVPDWEMVIKGLQKMYVSDVLGKLSVMRHVHFGFMF